MTQLGYTATGHLEQLVTANDDAHFQFYNGVNLLTEYIAPGVTGTDDWVGGPHIRVGPVNHVPVECE